MEIRLSLIIPVYNAATYITDSMEKISAWMDNVSYNVEIILINDGSNDGTLLLMENYTQWTDNRLQISSYAKNKGKGYAVKQGMMVAKGQFRIFTDADIPYGFDIFDSILYYLEFKDFDVCIGNRKSLSSTYLIEKSPIRKITSLLFTAFASRFVVTGINDTQCGLKGFKGNVADQLFSKLCINSFGFDVELLYLSYKSELDIKRLPVSFVGNSNSTISLVKDSCRMLVDVIMLPFRYHFTNQYK